MARIPASELMPDDVAPAPRGRIPADQLVPESEAKEPSAINKLSGYLAAANRVVNPMSGIVRDIAQPDKGKERIMAGLEGLRQRQTESGDPEAQALNLAGRHGPALAATAMFPPAGAANLAGLASLRYAPALGRAGAHAARVAAAAGSAGTTAGLGTLAASTAAGDPALDESIQVGQDYATGEVLAPGIGLAAKGLGETVKAAGAFGLEKATNLISGTTPAAWNTLRKQGEKVASYARQGMTEDIENKPIARALQKAQELGQAAKEEAQGFARSAQGRIKDVTSGASRNYRAMIDYLHEDLPGVRFDAAGKVYDRMEQYIKNNATLRGSYSTEGASKKILDIYAKIKNSFDEGLTPGEAADYLQELTEIQRDNMGKSASGHARELKGYLMEALPGEFKFPTPDTFSPGGISIADVRGEYRAAKEIERGLKAFTKAEDPRSGLELLLRKGGKTGEAIKKAMGRGKDSVPGFADDVAAMRAAEAASQPEINAAKAGAQFAPKFSDKLARTGLTAGIMSSLASALGGSGMAIASAPFSLLGMSPRLSMETRLAAQKGTAAFESYLKKNASKFPPVIANAIRAHREEKEKK